MDRKADPTDPTDEQWALLEPLLSAAKPGGRPRSVDLREVTNALLDLLRSGCAWRLLPHEFPPWGTVWSSVRCGRDDGTLERLHDELCGRAREADGRDRQPSAGCRDSQTVKTAEQGGRAATTPARRRRGASAALSSIPWD